MQTTLALDDELMGKAAIGADFGTCCKKRSLTAPAALTERSHKVADASDSPR